MSYRPEHSAELPPIRVFPMPAEAPAAETPFVVRLLVALALGAVIGIVKVVLMAAVR